MSYASGIGNPQETNHSIAPSEAKPVQQASARHDKAAATKVSDSNVRETDQATLSASAGIVAQALEGSDTRSAKVASLQQAIAAGTYNVPSSDVAGKIIQSLLE